MFKPVRQVKATVYKPPNGSKKKQANSRLTTMSTVRRKILTAMQNNFNSEDKIASSPKAKKSQNEKSSVSYNVFDKCFHSYVKLYKKQESQAASCIPNTSNSGSQSSASSNSASANVKSEECKLDGKRGTPDDKILPVPHRVDLKQFEETGTYAYDTYIFVY